MLISVIIPVKNGGAKLHRCLDSLMQSKYPYWECVVVDDGSEDDSKAVARSFGVTVVQNGTNAGGPARARNLGAQLARGEVLFFVDADVLLHPDTLTRVSRIMGANEAPSACFGSYDDSPTEPNFLSQYRNLQHHYVHQNSKTEAYTFWSGCGAIRREVFLELGGFSTSYPRPSIEDIELGYRLRANGYAVQLVKTLQVSHMKRWTPANVVITDVRDRAFPWACLLLRLGQLQDDLNLQTAQRVSSLLVLLAAGTAALAVFSTVLLIVTGFSLLGVLALNRDFYTFLRRKRGVRFALLALPWHWFYFFYSSLCFGLCLLLYRLLRFRNPAPPLSNVPPLPPASPLSIVHGQSKQALS